MACFSEGRMARSSGGEHYVDTVGVDSSNLSGPTRAPRCLTTAWGVSLYAKSRAADGCLER